MIFAVNSKFFPRISEVEFEDFLNILHQPLFLLQKICLYEKLFKLHLNTNYGFLVFFFWQTSPIQLESGKEEKTGSKTKETEM